MSEVKHTPGKWLSQYDDNGFFYVFAEGGPSPYIIATGGEGDVDAANASLAAAAPDLLAVAREACAIFDRNYESDDEYNGDLASDLWKNEIHRKLTEAIAKAGGE